MNPDNDLQKNGSQVNFIFVCLHYRMEKQKEDKSNYVPIIEDHGDVESFILKVYKSFPFTFLNVTNPWKYTIFIYLFNDVSCHMLNIRVIMCQVA